MEADARFESEGHGWVWFGGSKPKGGPFGQGRSVLAVVEVAGLEHFKVEVNSRERLERYVDFLRRAGAAPAVESQSRIDPALDLPAPGEAVGSAGRPPREHEDQLAALEAEAMAAWRRTWVDEHVPALGGLTPREAAADPDARPLLEALLRDFEYREDAARPGRRPRRGRRQASRSSARPSA